MKEVVHDCILPSSNTPKLGLDRLWILAMKTVHLVVSPNGMLYPCHYAIQKSTYAKCDRLAPCGHLLPDGGSNSQI
jgi:hypothetical protein